MSDIINKLWCFCHTLRHDGIDYGDNMAQKTHRLFLMVACERGNVIVPKGYSIIAHQFIGGIHKDKKAPSPARDGRKEPVMPHSYVSCFIHYVFSTKGRMPCLTADIRPRLWAYMGGIARAKEMDAVCIGGEDDHTHALISLPATLSIAKGIQLIKGSSSKWLHENYPPLQKFAWQEGYGAFSVGYASLANVREYIEQQAIHHQRHTFKEEFLAFLHKYHIPYDEKYIGTTIVASLGSFGRP